jgi:hypothetical protein
MKKIYLITLLIIAVVLTAIYIYFIKQPSPPTTDELCPGAKYYQNSTVVAAYEPVN